MSDALSPEYKAMHGLIGAEEYLELTGGVHDTIDEKTRAKIRAAGVARWKGKKKKGKT